MVRRTWLGIVGLLPFLIVPGAASAGMPSFTLADVKRSMVHTVANPTGMRLEAISFFLLGLLVCTLLVQVTWNSLREDFAWLPRLSYGKALGVVFLWGLLFVLVLTMISGARELMTPGAWEKSGLTYRVVEDPAAVAVEQQINTRHEAIETLRSALFDYAKTHGDSFPTADHLNEIPDSLWQVPGASGQRYAYVGGRRIGDEDYQTRRRPLAYEADAFGPDRLVVMTDGWIVWMPASEIERALTQEQE